MTTSGRYSLRKLGRHSVCRYLAGTCPGGMVNVHGERGHRLTIGIIPGVTNGQAILDIELAERYSQQLSRPKFLHPSQVEKIDLVAVPAS